MTLNFVKTSGTNFEIDGPTPVSGTNCYFLAYCSDVSRRAALLQAKSQGANVIRCWAFLAVDHFSADQVAFQYVNQAELIVNDGPNGLERLDALILAAEELDIRLILPLVNHWDDFGGMPSWVKWLESGSDVTAFYRSQKIKDTYMAWLRAILTRRNTLTGRLYSEEPAIMAWELTNEARCCSPGGQNLLRAWVAEMAAFVKDHDSNHLLALGDEGFFYKSGRGHLYDGTYGVDWEANLAITNIDFGTYHFYPQNWGFGDDLGIAARWIGDHAQVGRKLNKPVLMEEFGLKLDTNHVCIEPQRSDYYRQWAQIVAQTGTAGCLSWMLGLRADDTISYVDPFVMYGPEDYDNMHSGQGKLIPG